jgi:CHAT domain-containing protein
MARAPYRLLLPSCDSGVAAPVGADELLGLVSSLVSLGSAGVLAGIVEINDRATAPLMVELHTRLEAGEGLAQALLGARQANAGDPLATATGHSFIAFGI